MTIKEKEEFLGKYTEEQNKIKKLEKRITSLKIMIITPGNPMFNTENYKDSESYISIMNGLTEKEEELKRLREENVETFMKITNALDRLENQNESDVLFYRYIRGMEWKAVSCNIEYSTRHIYRIYKSALEHLELE